MRGDRSVFAPSPRLNPIRPFVAVAGLALLTLQPAFAEPRVVTLEGDIVAGAIDGIDANGVVTMGQKQWPLDGLRSIVPTEPTGVEDTSDGRVVLICGSEIAASGIKVIEEEVIFQVPGLGEWSLPIDAVRALRFGQLQRGSRFQKGLLEWEASRDFDTIFISGGAELKEADGLIEEIDDATLVFERDGEAELQTVPKVRVYGAVLASPLLRDRERPTCSLSLIGGTRLRADIREVKDGIVKLGMVEKVEMEIPWSSVRRIGIRSPRLAYLSDLEAAEVSVRPIVAPRREPQLDRTVSGLTIQIGEQTYDKGLGFAAGTQMTYLNDEGYDLFLAEIGLDTDSAGLGDCEFVVSADGQELYRKRMRGGDSAQLIKVDVAGSQRITLSVDPGEDLDIADHADWADACFLQRSK